MAALISVIRDRYNYLFYELADERTRDSFPSAGLLMVLLPFYLYFCTRLGPRLMKDRKPFELKTPIFYYNLFQILVSAYNIYFGIKGGWFNGYSFKCQPVDRTINPQTEAMITGCLWYTTVKLIDLMDTVFFVLRKKDRQISFLHLFHHTMMPIGAFICQKYFPNGHGTLVGLINCFVHVIMYSYYLISGLGPEYQKYLWWKKHVTTLQLVQFCIVFVHNFIAIVDSTCEYPKPLSVLLCLHSLQFIYMFGSFYYATYIKSPQVAANGKTNGKANGKANGVVNGKSNGEANGNTNGIFNGKANGEANGKTIDVADGKCGGDLKSTSERVKQQ